ncbi:hypothetical protein FAZ90_12185 [Vibrio cyclitrophicus]|nr:hypothetical protein FAZ90_12185 [Vibrio cyclitrophicus]
METKSKLSPANSYQELTLLDDNQKPWLVAIRLFVFTPVCLHFLKVKIKRKVKANRNPFGLYG